MKQIKTLLVVLAALVVSSAAQATIDVKLTNNVAGAACFKIDTSEPNFGYSISKNVKINANETVNFGQIFDGAYLIYTPYKDQNCTVLLKSATVLWAPYKPGTVTPWTAVLK